MGHNRHQRIWWFFVLLAFVCRFGEATNPGPREIQIGCLNPNGVLGKGGVFAELPRGAGGTIWAVSETHLTKPGKSKFDLELKVQKTGQQMHCGADVPPKSETLSAVGGKQRGVCFISDLPGRSMTQTWPDSEWQKGRFHAACYLAQNRWIKGGVVYGYAKQPTTIATKEKTDAMCNHLHERIVQQSTGLRFIGGDFNQELPGTQKMQEWCDMGWVNVQVWAAQKLNKPIVNTCRNNSVKDHLFVSPELAVYLKDVYVEEEWFADHAVLRAVFHDLGKPPSCPVWRQPSPIDWKNVPPLPEMETNKQAIEDMNEWYADIAHRFEERIDSTLKAHSKPGLLSSQKGRGQTLEVTWVTEFSAAPKVARKGEIQPTFHGSDQQHSRLLKQTRRLMNYLRIAKHGSAIESSKAAHRDLLWQAVIKATGFSNSFETWWGDINHAQFPELPRIPPTVEIAEAVLQVVQSHLRKYEAELNKRRVQKAKQRRKDDPHVIFRDLRNEPPVPIQVLVDSVTSTIVDIDQVDNAFVVEPENKWMEDQPVVLPQSTTEIIHAEPDKIWVESIEGIQVGDEVKQEKYIGDLTELFHRFGTEWQSRWDRHRDTPMEFWDPIIDFAQTSLPRPPRWEYKPIGYNEWMESLKKKKKRAATGPDAMAREDLLHMPKDLVMDLLQIFEQIEQGRPWPQQLVVGFVVSLEKVMNAKTTNEYRPITVFAVAYRNWGSIRAKEILQYLQGVSPATCTGNLPGKQASQVWMGVQMEIEEAVLSGSKVSGAVIDLVKAFNLLPRSPIFAALATMGVASEILRAWNQALFQMHRRFKIRGSVGPPVGSSTGFAEGDALSVTAMLAANLICHQWVAHKSVNATLWSYVDNIEITSPTLLITEECLHQLQEFARILDVEIDQKKTYLWSIDPAERKAMKSAGLSVKTWARDLGGHLQYCLCPTNSTITKKAEKMMPLWQKLARSLAPYGQKLRAVIAKAWPLVLHAVGSVHLSDDFFVPLRSGALKGMKCSRSGTSAAMHFSLVENPKADPQCYALMSTVLMFRQLHCPEKAAYLFSKVVERTKQRPAPGPCSVLIHRLHQIGWRWSRYTEFLDHQNRVVDIFDTSVQELRCRITQGWQDRVQAMCAVRKTLRGLNQTCPVLTVSGMQKWSPEEQALLRTSLNGTFFTYDYFAKQKRENNANCRHCNAPDSQMHRHWECPAFQNCRSHLTAEQVIDIRSLNPAVCVHGWMPEPPSLRPFQKAITELSLQTDQHDVGMGDAESIWLFTDGGCRAPTSPISKLASWGVAIGNIESQQIIPLSSGVLPGLVQTAVRAEIVALISACEYAIKTKSRISFAIDNDLVFSRMKKFITRDCHIKPNQKDADLWQPLRELARRLRKQVDVVVKVFSHQNLDLLETDEEIWCCTGNNVADSIATHAVFTQPQVWTLWQELQKEIAIIHTLREAIHKTIVQIGKQAIRAKPETTEEDKAPRQARVQREDMVAVKPLPLIEPLPLRYKIDSYGRFLEWWNHQMDDSGDVKLVSWFQLNALYENAKLPSLSYSKSTKRWSTKNAEPRQGTFVTRTNSFARFVQGMYMVADLTCHVLHIRPNSECIQFWTQCLAVKIRRRSLELSEALLQENQAVFRSVNALRAIDI